MRRCACTWFATTNAIENLTYALMWKIHGRRVTHETPVAWARCPVCKGTGDDPRP